MEVARRDLRGVIIIPNPHHYVLSMGAVFSMLGGLYFWFEKITGVRYSEILGKIHFWSFFIGVNLTFFPMHFLGVAGMPRRIPDYPDAYFIFNKIASWGSYISAISSLFFFYVVLHALSKGAPHSPLAAMVTITRHQREKNLVQVHFRRIVQ